MYYSARRYPPIDFFSDIASNGKSEWDVGFNWIDPKLPVVNDPVLGVSRQVLNFTVPESYGGGGTSTENPRSQLQAPKNLRIGSLVWISFSLLIPASQPTPTLPSPIGWQSFFQLWGPSDTGYPSFRIAYEGDEGDFGWKRQPDKGGEWALQLTPPIDTWMDFALAVHMHPDPTLGWIEVWTNFGSGWAQEPLAASSGDTLVGNRLYTETMTAGYSATTMYSSHIQNYRKAGMYTDSTVYHGDHRQVPIVDYSAEAAALVAGTFTALDPQSHV